MSELRLEQVLRSTLMDGTLYYLVLSGRWQQDPAGWTKVTAKPVQLKSEMVYQLTYHFASKVTHRNLSPGQAATELLQLLGETFRQGQLFTQAADYQVFVNRDDSCRILRQAPTRQAPALSHNRQKEYLLAEGVPHDFLVRLGVMNAQGKVLAQKYDKFRQINRFVEFVADVVNQLPTPGDRPLRIVDFGSGKSYLTFALYYFLKTIRGLDVEILGLDLKQDVIEECSHIASDLGYQQLHFVVGDIASYQGWQAVEMVVTLHACDTATDAALAKAVQWGAEVILAVPCCQHELADKLHSRVLRPLEKHGIIKERLAALATDSLRAAVLEIVGYEVQLLEFIDLAHTPKNLLIRAVKSRRSSPPPALVAEYLALREFWSLDDLYIERAFGKVLTDQLR